MPTRSGPCNWPLDYTSNPPPPAYEELPHDTVQVFEDAATAYLWNWTGRRLGTCPVTVIPEVDPGCAVGWSTYHGTSGHRPVLQGSRITPCGCGPCSSLPRRALVKVPGPVESVTLVTVDGANLLTTDYQLVSRSMIERLGADWPSDPDIPWTITYERGVAVPSGGRIAAAELAVQIWKAATGDKSCQLPSRVQTISRQGVTVAMIDGFDDLDAGHTGVWIIDSWVASVTRPQGQSAVYSPERYVERSQRSRPYSSRRW